MPLPFGRRVGALCGGLLLWSCLAGGISTAAADLVIIGNPQLPADSIDSRDLKRIYLGKKSRWSDDSSVVPVMMKSGPLQDEFVTEYLDRSVNRFVTHWRQLVFTGKGVPPRSFATENELVDFISRTPGAVGFASPGADVADVKVLRVE
jgi:ABC-type phosphate transport system substrate-binding protein